MLAVLAAGLALGLAARGQSPLPTVVVDEDDVRIAKSCRIAVKRPIHDDEGDGVVHVVAPGITVEFAQDAVLEGPDRPAPDGYTGTGIRLDGVRDVTLRGVRVRKLKVGVHATRADGLVIEGFDGSDLFRHRLHSTPEAEDAADWLWPHDNDAQEWRTRYGAAICIERSARPTIRGTRCRAGQNGIILDRVALARIYDNDASFLSGWGLALWRSNDNVIARNAFDFCIRGYSHGVYNRGQDSAGILLFEQCSSNVIAENSITHGGDGVFGFAGKEALGDRPPASKPFDYTRRGCNDNAFLRNDLSFAAAHGLEMTFSFGNTIRGNVFQSNAICGIWGGYSQDTLIAENEFLDNGTMGYGLERGGVNIEHGVRNVIRANAFRNNTCGVHLFAKQNDDFPKSPWGRANWRGCADNVVAENRFTADSIAIHLRGAKSTQIADNALSGCGRDLDADAASTTRPGPRATPLLVPPKGDALPGTSRPVGARNALRGRENIIMTEWGPWDHETPLVRAIARRGLEHRFALHAMKSPVASAAADTAADVWIDAAVTPPVLVVRARESGVTPYHVTITAPPAPPTTVSGVIVAARWKTRFFATSARPDEDAAAWRRDSARDDAIKVELDHLTLPFGGGGPSSIAALANHATLAAAKLPSNGFGLVAETSMPLPKGKWRITTLSDDGIRVTADRKVVIDRFTWHVPTKDSAVLEIAERRTVALRVEYFELDGHAVLTLAIERAE